MIKYNVNNIHIIDLRFLVIYRPRFGSILVEKETAEQMAPVLNQFVQIY